MPFLVILGGLLVMFGLMAIIGPFAEGLPIELIVGILLLGRASMQLYYAFKVRSWGLGMPALGLATLSAVAGALLIVYPITMMGVLRPLVDLSLIVAVYLICTGGLELLHGIELRPASGWVWGIVNGCVAVLLGLMIWRQVPLSGDMAVGFWTGLNMLVAGFCCAMLGVTESWTRAVSPAAGSAGPSRSKGETAATLTRKNPSTGATGGDSPILH